MRRITSDAGLSAAQDDFADASAYVRDFVEAPSVWVRLAAGRSVDLPEGRGVVSAIFFLTFLPGEHGGGCDSYTGRRRRVADRPKRYQ